MTQASISALSTGASVTSHIAPHSAPPCALLSTAGTGQSYTQHIPAPGWVAAHAFRSTSTAGVQATAGARAAFGGNTALI